MGSYYKRSEAAGGVSRIKNCLDMDMDVDMDMYVV